MVDQMKVKTIVGPRRACSATAPKAIMGVIAANMSWKTQNAIEGIRGLPIEGFSSTPLRPKYPLLTSRQLSDDATRTVRISLVYSRRSPMYAFPVSLNASE